MPGKVHHYPKPVSLRRLPKAGQLAFSLAMVQRGGLGGTLHVHGSYIESKSGYQFGRLIATSNAEFSNGVARLIAISQVIGGFTCD